MRTSRIVVISALTTIAGAWIAARSKLSVPGFSR